MAMKRFDVFAALDCVQKTAGEAKISHYRDGLLSRDMSLIKNFSLSVKLAANRAEQETQLHFQLWKTNEHHHHKENTVSTLC